MSASSLRLFSESLAAGARSRAPCISCESVIGIAGRLVVTERATTVASDQPESMAAIRAMLARTAMIFAARSDPKAIVLTGTDVLLISAFWVTHPLGAEAGERLYHSRPQRQKLSTG